jgi:alkanesulfonate monooxygenase SsuD/methylene tetrahydromethanopterin reductase-like flavin-dependent oxidoreductase (luciferase family)
MIAAASRRTRRLRFANMVNILPFRNPLLVAEEAAMLDNLTGGRLDLGLGRDLRPPEFEAFAVDQPQSREMFVESLLPRSAHHAPAAGGLYPPFWRN